VDQYESGQLAGSLLLRMMQGQIKPVMAWGNAPILAQTLCQNTAEGAMKDFVAAARAAESGGLLAATAFGGFQMADIHDAGLSVVTVADANRPAAETACNAILDVAWAQKEDFIYHGQPLQDAIAQAKRMGEQSGGPILLLDHADNCASGSTQDTMYVLKEALRQGLSGIAVAPIRDPEAVAKMVAAGVGARVTLAVGGKMDMPSIRRKGEPLTLTGVIRTITDGEYTITGPQFTGLRCFMGRTAVLDTGVAQVVVCSVIRNPGTAVYTRVSASIPHASVTCYSNRACTSVPCSCQLPRAWCSVMPPVCRHRTGPNLNTANSGGRFIRWINISPTAATPWPRNAAGPEQEKHCEQALEPGSGPGRTASLHRRHGSRRRQRSSWRYL